MDRAIGNNYETKFFSQLFQRKIMYKVGPKGHVILWKTSYNPYYMPGCNMHVKWLKIEQKKESLLNVISGATMYLVATCSSLN